MERKENIGKDEKTNKQRQRKYTCEKKKISFPIITETRLIANKIKNNQENPIYLTRLTW